MTNRLFKHAWRGSLVAALLLTIPITSHAQVSQPSLESTDQEAADFDYANYAQHFQVTTAVAEQRFRIQAAAGDLESTLLRNESATFGGLWIEHSPTFRVVVQFTSAGSQTLTPYLTNPELAAVVEVRTAAQTVVALEQDQVTTQAAINSLNVPHDSDIRIQTGRVEVYVVDPTTIETAQQQGRIVLPANVDIVTVSRLSQPQADVYGGLTVTTCTSGFAVKHTDNTKGIATAGHCDNAQTLGAINLTYKNGIYSYSHDVQWHTAVGNTIKNQIRYKLDGTRRNITATKSRVSQSVGTVVCKYGQTTAYTCGTISSKNYAPSYVANANATFIRVNNDAGYTNLTAGGDSGGPWFVNGTAYGIQSGDVGADPNDSIYMAVNYLSGMNVSVMTAP
ncbi:S1 family peptidase [Herpetosiphon llansteffanensis]